MNNSNRFHELPFTRTFIIRKGGSLWFAFVACLLAFTPFHSANADPLVEYFFDESGGSAVTNSGTLGSSLDATMCENPGFAATDLHGTGVSGTGLDTSAAIRGSGVSHSAAATSGSVGALQSITIMGWFKTVSGERYDDDSWLVAYGDQAKGFGIAVPNTGDAGSGNNQFKFRLNDTTVLAASPSTTINNDWMFFAVTYNGSQVSFYTGTLSGSNNDASQLGSSVPVVTTSVPATEVALWVAASGPNTDKNFVGSMDVVRIFGSTTDASGALSLSEIQNWQSRLVIP